MIKMEAKKGQDTTKIKQIKEILAIAKSFNLSGGNTDSFYDDLIGYLKQLERFIELSNLGSQSGNGELTVGSKTISDEQVIEAWDICEWACTEKNDKEDCELCPFHGQLYCQDKMEKAQHDLAVKLYSKVKEASDRADMFSSAYSTCKEELKKAEHRAEVAEKALYNRARKYVDLQGYSSHDIAILAKEFVVPDDLKEAENELMGKQR